MVRKKPTALVSWSGGVDSTSALWQALRDGHCVIAHHIRLQNRTGRAPFEKAAVDAMQSWFEAQGLTNYLYFETGFDYGTYPYITRDINIVGFVAGMILSKYPQVDTVIVGQHAGDVRRQRDPMIQGLRRALTETMAGRKMRWLTPNAERHKSDVMQEMPSGLLELCWSCRKPLKGKPCGACHACKETGVVRQF